MVFCPDCLKSNLYHNVIHLCESCYICENDECLFSVNQDEYDKLIYIQECYSESNNIKTQNNDLIQTVTKVAITDKKDSFFQCEKVLSDHSNRDDSISIHLDALDAKSSHSSTIANEEQFKVHDMHKVQSKKSTSHLNESNKLLNKNSDQPMDKLSKTTKANNCPLETQLEVPTRLIKQPRKTAKSTSRIKGSNSQPENSRKSQKSKSGVILKLQQPDSELEANSKKSLKSKENEEKINKKTKKTKRECKKSNKIDTRLDKEHKFSQDSVKTFNWLSLPLEMSVESKICCFLATHLDLFRTKVISRDDLDTVRVALAICNELSSRAQSDLARTASYTLLSYLHELAPDSGPTCEPELDILSEHSSIGIDQYLPGPYDITIEANCRFCFNSDRKSQRKYAIEVPNDRAHLNIKQGRLEYKLRCGKCWRNNGSRIQVAMKKAPSHIVLQFASTGIHDGLTRYMRTWTISERRLHLVGVVEVSSDDSSSDWHNSKSTIDQFLVSQAIRESHDATDVPAGRLTLHFRNQNGWCKLSESGMVSSWSPLLEVTHPTNIQYLIYGTVKRPSLGCDTAAVNELLDKFSQSISNDTNCGPVSNQTQSDNQSCRSPSPIGQSVSLDISLSLEKIPHQSMCLSPDRSISEETDSFNHNRGFSSRQSSSPAKSQSSSERGRSTPGSIGPVLRCPIENNQYRSKSPVKISVNQEDLSKSLQRISVNQENQYGSPNKLSHDQPDRLTTLTDQMSDIQEDLFGSFHKISEDQEDRSQLVNEIEKDQQDRIALPDQISADPQDRSQQMDLQSTSSSSSECSSIDRDRSEPSQGTEGNHKRVLPEWSISPPARKRARIDSDSSDSYCASLHSKSTASQFSDETVSDGDAGRDRVCAPRVASSRWYQYCENAHTAATRTEQQQVYISSSGVSSISSSRDWVEPDDWLPTPPRSHHSRSTLSQFSSTGSEAASSSSRACHPVFRKRVLSIDDLIEHKRRKLSQSKSQ